MQHRLVAAESETISTLTLLYHTKWALWLPDFHHQHTFLCRCFVFASLTLRLSLWRWFLFIWFGLVWHFWLIWWRNCLTCLWPLHTSNSIAHIVAGSCYRFNGNHQHTRDMWRPMSVSVAAYAGYLDGLVFRHSSRRNSTDGIETIYAWGEHWICQMTKHNCDGEVFILCFRSSSSVAAAAAASSSSFLSHRIFSSPLSFLTAEVKLHQRGQCQCLGVADSLL